jgi:predicted phosphoadenosine phosphosulfate sulfurtransferase
VRQYIESWLVRGYERGIPDEVPMPLMRLGLAPSHRAIAEALLRNDMALLSLGFSPPRSEWYGALKRIEINARPVTARSAQAELPL